MEVRLASRTGASVSSVQREADRAEQAGVVSSHRLGNVRLVKVADSPLTAPLTELLLRSFGPRQVLAEECQPGNLNGPSIKQGLTCGFLFPRVTVSTP